MNLNDSTRMGPLQFLYGGLFVRKNRRRTEKQVETTVSLASQDSQTMEQPTLQESSQSWWQKLAQSLQGQTLACDEDPSSYEFAFSVSERIVTGGVRSQ